METELVFFNLVDTFPNETTRIAYANPSFIPNVGDRFDLPADNSGDDTVQGRENNFIVVSRAFFYGWGKSNHPKLTITCDVRRV